MKIYFENYKLNKNIKKGLDIYFIYKNINFYSNEGIFLINNKKIFKLNILDKKIKKIKFNNYNLLIDESEIINEISYQLPVTYISTVSFYYKLYKTSNIKFVIEYSLVENDENKPINFYFEVSDFEIDNLFIKEEINEFLSVLTNI